MDCDIVIIVIIRAVQDLDKVLETGKVLVIYGPRRVGKTTLVENYLSTYIGKFRLLSGDDIGVRQVFSSESIETISRFVQDYDLIVIDEAQRIPKIGWGLKILVDHNPKLKVIATGSASFDLANKIGEPLTGRKTTLILQPLSQTELLSTTPRQELRDRLTDFLIYGSYPEIITSKSDAKKKAILEEITGSYLLKDILEIEKVKASKLLVDLLRLLAFQVGSEVSLNELGKTLNLDPKTISRYLDLLEKAFVIVNLRGLARNLRKEVTRTSKYYFYDNGIRNALISNFNGLSIRNDIGSLWENFLFMERIKKQNIQKIYSNNYFWRTWDQDEIDLVEEREGKYYAWEFKYKPQGVSIPVDFANSYPSYEFKEINIENYLDFLI